MTRFARLFLALIALLATALAQKGLAEGPAISPFKAMRVVEDGIEVQVDDDTWYALEQVAGVDTATLVRESRRICGRQWWKRITEDLPALLSAMGTDVGRDVDLVVRDLGTGETSEMKRVRMTHEKRQGLREVHKGRAPGAEDRVLSRPRSIPGARARQDLEVFEKLLDERFAYRELREVDLDAMLREARAELDGDEVRTVDLARWVDRILRAFGDGHSRLSRPVPNRYPGYLPFLVQQVEGGVVAFRSDRAGFVDPDHPFVESINGAPIARWLEASRARGVQGGAMMQKREAERGLRDISDVRVALGQPVTLPMVVGLRGEEGAREVTVAPGRRKPIYGTWPRTATRRLDGDIGYLRIPSMTSDDAELDALEDAMRSFRDTKGLVIDVRGNGGGSRDALRRLLPYFMAPDAEPVVTNVAAARLSPGQRGGSGVLADRGLYPADWDGYDAAQRRAIAKFLKTFEPSWRLPARKFSPFCFLVQRHADNGDAYHYDKPVVVLIDRVCYSATDIFASAFSVLPQVTLAGEPTSGGSGRARTFELPNSGIRLRLSSMASFRPDGALFEGNGVVPDIVLETAPSDLIGASDTVLQRALELLR